MQASNSEQAAALKQEISQLETDYERAQADIRKASPHYAALTQPQPLKLKEIQAATRRRHRAARICARRGAQLFVGDHQGFAQEL